VASGASGILGGTRKFVIGNTLNFGTPIESKWMGEVVKSSAGLNRKKASEIVEALLPKYEERLKEGYPEGYTFEQLYDVDREMPKPEYKMLYERVKVELEDLGLKFKRCYC